MHRRNHVHGGRMRVSGGHGVVWRHLREHHERRDELRRMRGPLRREPGVRRGGVRAELSDGHCALRSRLHRCQKRSVQLRNVRRDVHGLAGLLQRGVFVSAGTIDVRRELHRHYEQSQELRRLPSKVPRPARLFEQRLRASLTQLRSGSRLGIPGRELRLPTVVHQHGHQPPTKSRISTLAIDLLVGTSTKTIGPS